MEILCRESPICGYFMATIVDVKGYHLVALIETENHRVEAKSFRLRRKIGRVRRGLETKVKRTRLKGRDC